MSFEKLLEQMDTLAKANAAPAASVEDGKKIQAAAADGANNDTQTNADTASTNGGDGLAADGIATTGDGKGGKAKDGSEKPLAKSFTLVLEDGTSMEAFDGTEMVKSLNDRLEVTAGELAAEKLANQTMQGQVMKSFEVAVGLLSAQQVELKAQGQLIKSLTEKVGALSQEGRGQRSVRSAADLAAVQFNKSLEGGAEKMSSEEILAKSMTAMKSGKISGLDATRIETSINMGVPVPQDLLSAISSK